MKLFRNVQTGCRGIDDAARIIATFRISWQSLNPACAPDRNKDNPADPVLPAFLRVAV